MAKKDNTLLFMFLAGTLFIGIIVILAFSQKERHQEYVDKVVSGKMALIEILARDNVIISEINKTFEKNSQLSQDQIAVMDEKWVNAKPESPLIEDFIENVTSIRLKKFIKDNPEFKEIFVTDRTGLLTGATNKTSDYYQADEEWWVKTYTSGNHSGEMEYDASAKVWSFPIFGQVKNSNGEVVGVIKAIFDIREIR